jgi:DNA-binding response OmpR family regulator
MPFKSGLDACREIKADPLCCDVPIAFLSARSQENEIRAGLDAGASIFLVKPFSMSQLSDTVRTLLRKPA